MDYPGASRRSRGIDTLRGAALLAMIVAHSARVVPAAGNVPLHQLISAAEPGISAAFLLLVGRSLVRSHNRVLAEAAGGVSAWYLRCLTRCAVLYALGIGLFLLHYGSGFPDVVLSPDILSVIAWALAVVGGCLKWSPDALPWALLVTVALAVGLEAASISVVGVNAGPGGVIPLLAFALLGAWYERLVNQPCPRWTPVTGALTHPAGERRESVQSWRLRRRSLLIGALGLGALAMALPGPLVVEHMSRYRVGAAEQSIWFWNHSVRGALAIAAPLLLLSGALDEHETKLHGPWSRPFRLAGRHALVGYVGHLCVLGLTNHLQMGFSGTFALVFVVSSLFCLVWAVALVLELPVPSRARAALRRRLGVAL